MPIPKKNEHPQRRLVNVHVCTQPESVMRVMLKFYSEVRGDGETKPRISPLTSAHSVVEDSHYQTGTLLELKNQNTNFFIYKK